MNDLILQMRNGEIRYISADEYIAMLQIARLGRFMKFGRPDIRDQILQRRKFPLAISRSWSLNCCAVDLLSSVCSLNSCRIFSQGFHDVNASEHRSKCSQTLKYLNVQNCEFQRCFDQAETHPLTRLYIPKGFSCTPLRRVLAGVPISLPRREIYCATLTFPRRPRSPK